MAKIKCGNCHEYHGSSVEVLNCYRVNKFGQAPIPVGATTVDQDTAAAVRLDRFNDVGIKPVTDEPLWPASDKQIKYALGLQDERILPDNWVIYDEPTLRKLEKDEVSGIITMLKALPRGDSKQHQWSMPPGRYALPVSVHVPELDGNGHRVNADVSTGSSRTEWRFYEIGKPTVGRWAGYTFIKRLIGSPGDYRKEDMSIDERNRVLALIDKDPKWSSLNYGKQHRICGICSSPLTNAESRKAGIGPVCRGKVGW